MDELLGGTECDPSLSLEVTFTGEYAQDLGGPRKDFLGAMMHNIKDKLLQTSRIQHLICTTILFLRILDFTMALVLFLVYDGPQVSRQNFFLTAKLQCLMAKV